MMPDLGHYGAEVLSAYAIALIPLAILVAATIHESRRTRRQLNKLAHNGDAKED